MCNLLCEQSQQFVHVYADVIGADGLVGLSLVEVVREFCVVIKGLKSVNNLPAPSIVPPFDVRSISCSCLYQMIE